MLKGKILLVEDEELVSMSLRFILERFGYQVLSTVNYGEMVTQKVIEERPDIILMDIKLMGKIDGIDAAKQVQETSNTPVIFVSALEEHSVIDRITIKNYAYLKKPYKGMELVSLIEEKLRESSC